MINQLIIPALVRIVYASFFFTGKNVDHYNFSVSVEMTGSQNDRAQLSIFLRVSDDVVQIDDLPALQISTGLDQTLLEIPYQNTLTNLPCLFLYTRILALGDKCQI